MLPPTGRRTPAFFSGHRACLVVTEQLIVEWLSSLKEWTPTEASLTCLPEYFGSQSMQAVPTIGSRILTT